MDEKSNIAILVLAAGESSRMGEKVKQILPWKDTTLLGNALEQAKTSMVDAIFVVLGAYEEKIMAEVQLESIAIIKNHNWKDGLGSSIAAGIEHFSSKALSFDALLIMLADQPLIDSNYLNKMMGNWRGNPSKIITTQYESRMGVPAIFGKEYFTELQKLNKDFGAKDIIASHKDAILALNPEGKEIDIDSWETYQEILNKKAK
ncbi:nucleotidyltransferase family protein [Maribacter algarum]|uniref:Nucleotidyltransferase family protein n=1 Tax=Maribacter algarum (ex Zhang et al. 2020) TaxID=2578118 RepID=A0A5S3PTU2_9FLAO|nr:nucleotidyltransferase family protein [Maribacter algarum]TMM57343.1 nucleotidyltransferase family protein [Maribacter algarum]